MIIYSYSNIQFGKKQIFIEKFLQVFHNSAEGHMYLVL